MCGTGLQFDDLELVPVSTSTFPGIRTDALSTTREKFAETLSLRRQYFTRKVERCRFAIKHWGAANAGNATLQRYSTVRLFARLRG